MQFNKLLNPVYSTITAFSMSDDGSIYATYVLGTGVDNDGEVTDFTPLVTEHKYLDKAQAQAVLMAPLKQEDLGKSFQDLMLGRIYTYLKENDLIKA